MSQNKIIIIVGSQSALDMKALLFPNMKVVTLLPEEIDLISVPQKGMKESDREKLKRVLEERIKNRTPDIKPEELRERITYLIDDSYLTIDTGI